MTTVVTGSTGLLGNNIVRELLAAGESVRVLTRGSSDPRPLEGLPVERLQGDVCDRASVERACRGARRVIHAAGHVDIGWRRKELYEQINVEGTRNVIAAAQENSASLVFVSSVNALGLGAWDAPADEEHQRPGIVPCPYVESKRRAEQLVVGAAAEQHAVVVNPGFMLGPWDWKPSSGRMLLEVGPRFVPFAPAGGCSVCDVRDVARGVIAAGERGQSGRRYILGGENLSYLQVWKLMSRTVGSMGPYFRIGPLIPFLGGMAGDLVGWLTGREPQVNSAATGLSRQVHYFSSLRAEEELGYRSRPFAESVADAWEWFCQWGYAKARRRTTIQGLDYSP